MATKSNETLNGRYFHRWNSEQGQAALAAANKALASMGMQIHFDGVAAAGILGDKTDEQLQAEQSHKNGLNMAQQADEAELERQRKVQEMIASAEKRAASNGN